MRRRPLRIFLSYAHEDRNIVMSIYKRLEKEGFKPWMDVENLHSGEEWTSAIEKAIRNSDVLIIFMSSHSINRRGSLQNEIRQSLSVAEEQKFLGEIFVIPVKLDESRVPNELTDIQYVDFSSRKFWAMLISSLEMRKEQLFGKKLDKLVTQNNFLFRAKI